MLLAYKQVDKSKRKIERSGRNKWNTNKYKRDYLKQTVDKNE